MRFFTDVSNAANPQIAWASDFEFEKQLKNIGYTVIKTNAKEKIGIETIKELLQNNITAFSGNSGVGKSTLINKLIKNYSDKELEVTTSMYPSTTLSKIIIDLGDIKIIDTPGLIPEKSIINYLSLKEI